MKRFIFIIFFITLFIGAEKNKYYWVFTDIHRFGNDRVLVEMLRADLSEKHAIGMQIFLRRKILRELKNVFFDSKYIKDDFIIAQCFPSKHRWGILAIRDLIKRNKEKPNRHYLHTKNTFIFKLTDDDLEKMKKWKYHYVITSVTEESYTVMIDMLIINSKTGVVEKQTESLSARELTLLRDYITGYVLADNQALVNKSFKSTESSLGFTLKNFLIRIYHKGNYVPPTEEQIFNIVVASLGEGNLPSLEYYDKPSLKRIFSKFFKKMIFSLNYKKK